VEDPAEDALGILVFANYRTEGPHRARVENLEKVLIELNKDRFTISGE
jgi:hypothetical protein